MAEITLIHDSIEFARDLAIDLEQREMLPTEDDILAALQIMDAQLTGVGEDTRAMFAIERAFELPDFELEVELMSDAEIASLEIGKSVVRARLDGFRWVGSTVTSGFGLRLFGVDVVEPTRDHVPTAFVPLEAVNLRLAA